MKLLKHLKENPFLGTFYGVILIASTIYQFNEDTALLVGIVLLGFVFLTSYWDRVIRLTKEKLVSDYNLTEIKKLKEELTKSKASDTEHIRLISSLGSDWAEVNNKNILLKRENEKLLLNIKDLEFEIEQLKEMPSSKGIEFIAEPADVPHIHVSDFYIGQEVELVVIPEDSFWKIWLTDVGFYEVGHKQEIYQTTKDNLIFSREKGLEFPKSFFRPVTKEKEAEK